jgi:divalent metal cation (Fe/Co/Zn/Cd) transporter
LGGELFIDLHLLCDPDLTVKEGHNISVMTENMIREKVSKPFNILIHIEPDIEDRHKDLEET